MRKEILGAVAVGFITILIGVTGGLLTSKTDDAPLVHKTAHVNFIHIDVKQIARELLTPMAFKCWVGIDQAESHFNSHAKNPDSTAKGMAQLLTSTYKAIGMRYSTDSKAEFVAQLAYVSRHYGGNNGLCLAYRNELKFHNY